MKRCPECNEQAEEGDELHTEAEHEGVQRVITMQLLYVMKMMIGQKAGHAITVTHTPEGTMQMACTHPDCANKRFHDTTSKIVVKLRAKAHMHAMGELFLEHMGDCSICTHAEVHHRNGQCNMCWFAMDGSDEHEFRPW